MDIKIPFREFTSVDVVIKIVSQVIEIFTLLLSSFFNVQTFHALFRAEVEFNVFVFAFVVIKLVRMYTKAVLFAVAGRHTLVTIHISQHVGCPWLARQEVKYAVCVLNVVDWARLHGMDEVWEFDRITDEEYWSLVTH